MDTIVRLCTSMRKLLVVSFGFQLNKTGIKSKRIFKKRSTSNQGFNDQENLEDAVDLLPTHRFRLWPIAS